MNLRRWLPTSPRQRLAALLALAALALGGQPAWLLAKAELAQWLLQRSWSQQLDGEGVQKPWPWADTHPVARLQLPRLDVDEIVLAGDSGRVLAFGPGWAEASAMPGAAGHTVISGHRDSHFRFLREVRTGDHLLLDTLDGRKNYRVERAEVVDSRAQRIALGGGDSLSLVTCWPFDAITAGGPMRYVVTAVPEASTVDDKAQTSDSSASATSTPSPSA